MCNSIVVGAYIADKYILQTYSVSYHAFYCMLGSTDIDCLLCLASFNTIDEQL